METATSIFGFIKPYIHRYIDNYDQTNFSFGLQKHCRNLFICFTEVAEPIHFIDFKKHIIKLGGIYYIPTNHHYILPYHPNTKFVAYTFPWFGNHPSYCKWGLMNKYATE